MSTTAVEPTDMVEQEMNTVIFYLKERDYIREFINKLVSFRARLALKEAAPALREEQTKRWIKHFQEVFDEIEQTVQAHFSESVAEGEDTKEFVFAKLKLRCYE